MSLNRIQAGGLQVAEVLYQFINEEAMPETGIERDAFWDAFGTIVHDLAPKNAMLLQKRDDLQAVISQWHRDNAGKFTEMDAYENFLRDIGYIVPEGHSFSVTTENVDPEIADIAGPQLVVPITNARYALNAANARFGSLYDALYGTDAISEDGGADRDGAFNPARGEKVIAWARKFLDDAAPLFGGSHADVTRYFIKGRKLAVSLSSGSVTGLVDNAQFRGFRGDKANPTSILLVNNGLHIEIVIDRTHGIGATDDAGVADVVIESAMSTIMDCEDSVAAVDTEDKLVVYRNWLGLMKGDLADTFDKGGKTDDPQAGRGPRIYRRQRQAAVTAFAIPDAGAQCRPADDHRHYQGQRWQRCARNTAGCAVNTAHRPARCRSERGSRKLPQGLDLRGGAQAARAERSQPSSISSTRQSRMPSP